MNKVILRGIVFLVGLGILFALATIYSFVIDVVPFIYLNILIAIGFAIALAFVSYYGAYFSYFYTRKQSLLFMALTIFFGWYFQWLQHINFLVMGKDGLLYGGSFLTLLTNPLLLASAVSELYTIGSYSVFGIQITQVGLLPVWFLELVIFTLVPLKMMLKYPMPPYDTERGRWFEKFQFSFYVNYVTSSTSLKADLSAQDAEAFEKLGKGYVNKHAEVYLFVLPNHGAAYITVWNVKYDRAGKNKERDLLFNQLLISAEFAHELLKKYPNKKKWLSVPA